MAVLGGPVRDSVPYARAEKMYLGTMCSNGAAIGLGKM